MAHGSKGQKAESIIQAVLILVLILLTIGMMLTVRNIQGNARVVNYAGILRGATQRLVKLEVVGQEDDELEQYLDDIFSGLMHGGGKYSLTHLDDADYNEKLDTMYNYWLRLKEEIDHVRARGYTQTDVIAMSEEYFQLADETVDAAEQYSQKLATKLRHLESVLIVVMALIVIMLIKQSIDEIQLLRRNRELRKKAYIDLHTGLPNKSRCEELLMNRSDPPDPTAVAIFDLNGLKEVNDTLGHVAGDALIMNFANLLRTSIPERHFVGRYGGDEFIAVLTETGEDEVKRILGVLQSAVDQYNEHSRQLQLAYAHGYAMSTAYQTCNLKILLEKADANMYKRKAQMKGGAANCR